MSANFRVAIIFRDKSKESAKLNFLDCCAVGHAHRDSLQFVRMHTLVVINFDRWKFS